MIGAANHVAFDLHLSLSGRSAGARRQVRPDVGAISTQHEGPPARAAVQHDILAKETALSLGTEVTLAEVATIGQPRG